MAASKWARWLAPIALAAVAAGTYMVVRSDLDKQHSTTARQSSAIVHNRRKAHQRAKPKIYVVRAGDSLSAIAVRTGVSQAALRSSTPRSRPIASRPDSD